MRKLIGQGLRTHRNRRRSKAQVITAKLKIHEQLFKAAVEATGWANADATAGAGGTGGHGRVGASGDGKGHCAGLAVEKRRVVATKQSVRGARTDYQFLLQR